MLKPINLKSCVSNVFHRLGENILTADSEGVGNTNTFKVLISNTQRSQFLATRLNIDQLKLLNVTLTSVCFIHFTLQC